MAFNGTWEVYTMEKVDEFNRSFSMPETVPNVLQFMPLITEIQQNGNDFVITCRSHEKSVTNAFTIGKEADITTLDGKHLMITVRLEDGMLLSHSGEFYQRQEIKDGELVEFITMGSEKFIRRSKKV